MKPFKLATLIISLSLTVVLFFVLVAWYLLQPVNSSDNTSQRFVIAKGEAISSVGSKLTQANLLRHPLVFRLSVKYLQSTWLKDGKSIQAGSFELSPDMDVWQIANTLSQGSEDVWLTTLEGWRREEIALTASSKLTNFSTTEFIKLTQNSEGRLFPDSYLVPLEYSASQLVDLLESTFVTKVSKGLKPEITASGKSLDEILILASLVEREARGSGQMRTVAGILNNRLEIGMALQVDATLQYAKGANRQGEWWAPPLSADKAINSLYNTYQNPGLPPAPICNPGLDAIKAVLNPEESDYIYYLHSPDGSIHFARTLEEHNRNIANYL